MAHSAVVRIYATSQDPDHDLPWQAEVPHSSTGSGVVIGPGLILTSAHVVANATFVQIQKTYAPEKAVAEVAGIGHDCDLALLRVKDAAFLADIAPAPLGELPDLRQRVAVVGFPIGGEEIAITEGVVSRIEVQRYSHSQRHLLAVTVDAAINKGNSGGPVFQDGKVVGIAFQGLDNTEASGQMVPAPIIRHFLDLVARGVPPKNPALGITTQALENDALRRRYRVPADAGGVLVLSVDHGGSAAGHLEVGDVILAIGGLDVARNATVLYRGRYRTRYDVAMGWSSIGDVIEIVAWRDGRRHKVRFPLVGPVPLVPRSQYETAPPYFIYAGLVFQVLTRDFLSTWEAWWDKAPKEFLFLYYAGVRSAQRREVVVLSQILADQVNVGYEHLFSETIVAVDGVPLCDLRDLVLKLERATGLIELKTSSDGIIVIDAAEARVAGPRILERYRIGRDRSPELAGPRAPAGPVTPASPVAPPRPAPNAKRRATARVSSKRRSGPSRQRSR